MSRAELFEENESGVYGYKTVSISHCIKGMGL